MHKPICISQLFTAVTKYYDKQLKGRNLFWLTVSEVSVHGHLAAMFLGHGEAKHDSREHLWSKAAHLLEARKQ
jgi:hypothetical protein